MKTLVRETYQIMGLNFKNLILFELVYRAATRTIFYQLVNMGLKFSLKMSGYSYLTLGNAARFLLKPWSLLVLLVQLMDMLYTVSSLRRKRAVCCMESIPDTA